MRSGSKALGLWQDTAPLHLVERAVGIVRSEPSQRRPAPAPHGRRPLRPRRSAPYRPRMLIALGDLAPSSTRAPTCIRARDVIGDVHIGAESSVWFHAVMRGDVHRIRIGARTNIQDNATIHVTHDRHATLVGDDVTVGHNAVLHGCTVGARCLIGIGAIVLDRCVIGDDCLIGAGALLTPGTVGRAWSPRARQPGARRPADQRRRTRASARNRPPATSPTRRATAPPASMIAQRGRLAAAAQGGVDGADQLVDRDAAVAVGVDGGAARRGASPRRCATARTSSSMLTAPLAVAIAAAGRQEPTARCRSPACRR